MTFKSERKVVLRVKEVSHSLTLEAGFGSLIFTLRLDSNNDSS